MGHFSMEKSLNPGSVLGGNQQTASITFVLGMLPLHFVRRTLTTQSTFSTRAYLADNLPETAIWELTRNTLQNCHFSSARYRLSNKLAAGWGIWEYAEIERGL